MVLRSRFPSIWKAASGGITADLTATLAAVTLSADATAGDGITADLTATLAAVTLIASGGVFLPSVPSAGRILKLSAPRRVALLEALPREVAVRAGGRIIRISADV